MLCTVFTMSVVLKEHMPRWCAYEQTVPSHTRKNVINTKNDMFVDSFTVYAAEAINTCERSPDVEILSNL